MSSGGPGNIVIRIGAETAQAITGLNRVNTALGDTMSSGQKATAGLSKAALPAAAALAGLGAAAFTATKAALADQAAQEKLAGQLDRVTDATADQIKASEDWISKTALATGVADDELRPALGKLASATGDLGTAQEELKLALDISAQSGKSLESVSSALAKAHAGSFGALQKLVPGMDKAVVATKDFTAVTGELSQLTAGAAAESANTAEGKFKRWQLQMDELQESLGTALIPVVQALADMLIPLTETISNHTGAVKIAVGIIAAFAAAILTANAAIKVYRATVILVQAATKVWAAVQVILNGVLNANPIGAVILLVAGLVTGIVIAYKKSETFRDIVKGAMEAVKTAVGAVAGAFTSLFEAAKTAFKWITEHWKLALFAFGPIGAAVYLIVQNFDKLKTAGENALNAIKTAIDKVTSAIDWLISKVEKLLGAIGRIHFPSIDLPGPFGVPARGAAKSPGAVATVGAGGTVINVYGAIDPEGTARTIERTLRSRSRRTGYVYRTQAF